MLFNIFFGFVLPWIILFVLWRKFPEVIILFVPLGIAIAFVSNDWGMNIFWYTEPYIEKNESLSAFPLNLGYFPLMACLFVTAIMKYQFSRITLIVFFTIFFSAVEYIALVFGRVHYLNGWDIIFTSGIYLAGFVITSVYANLLSKYKMLSLT
ncbi:hypothetical protein [Thalassobacillus sp. C254]|uniref:hypothetical protein n=1 Tax=Thalassobacillus sp. C254 TaxID=1225341 RepID=UPI0006D1FDFC|nr:hypothetical protein [Thalassobacillus sp. C254]